MGSQKQKSFRREMRREEGHFDGRFMNKVIPSKKMKNSWKFQEDDLDDLDDEQNQEEEKDNEV